MGPAGKKIAQILASAGISGALIASLMAMFLQQDCPKCPVCPSPSDSLLVGNIYVSALYGDNGNSGSSRDDPFFTIMRAVHSSESGDTIIVMSGVYNEHVVISGRESITILAEPEACLDCDGVEGISSSSACFVINSDYTTLGGLEIKNSPASAVIVSDCSNANVVNCRLHASWAFGYTTWNAIDSYAAYNDIYNNGYMGGGYGTHGVYFRLNSPGAIFEYNNVYGNAGSSIHVNGQKGKHYDGVKIRNNFEFNNAAGFDFMNVHDSEYSNNISFNNRMSLGPSNAVVEFLYDADVIEDALGSDRFICENNIIITTDIANGIQIDRGKFHGVTSDGYIGKCIVITPSGIAHIEDWGNNTMIDWNTIVLGRWTLSDMSAIFSGGETLFNNPVIPVDGSGYCPDVEKWKACFEAK